MNTHQTVEDVISSPTRVAVQISTLGIKKDLEI